MTATSYHQMFKPNRASFPLQIIDPRSAEIRTITLPDARSYFDLMLSSAAQAIAAYEAFITKYEQADAERGGSK